MSNFDTRQEPEWLAAESTAVQNYLGILQSVISRMANNSTNCKTWCITLVSAIIVVIADKEKPNYVWTALLPVVLFFFLDAYYLAQERSFRLTYNDFVKKIQTNSVSASDLFIVAPIKGFNVPKATFEAVFSFAVYPFYVTLIVLLFIGRYLVL